MCPPPSLIGLTSTSQREETKRMLRLHFKNDADLQPATYFFEPSVAEDPSGATDCTTQWNKQPELVILRVSYCYILFH